MVWEEHSFFGLLLYQYPPKQSLAENALAADFQKNCEAKVAESCTALGALYVYGQGVPKDYEKAAEFYQRACDLDGAIGCNILASNYRDGTEGMPQDYEKANSLFLKSCDAQHKMGCYELGIMYQYGQGTTKDFAKTLVD